MLILVLALLIRKLLRIERLLSLNGIAHSLYVNALFYLSFNVKLVL